MWFENPRVAKPVRDDASGAADNRLFPRDCREEVRAHAPGLLPAGQLRGPAVTRVGSCSGAACAAAAASAMGMAMQPHATGEQTGGSPSTLPMSFLGFPGPLHSWSVNTQQSLPMVLRECQSRPSTCMQPDAGAARGQAHRSRRG